MSSLAIPANPWLRRCLRAGAFLVLTLSLLCLAWEWRLAPLREGGSWLMLKALPLLFFLPAFMRGNRRSAQWLTLLLLGYLGEGSLRALSDQNALSQVLAGMELALSVAAFACTASYARLSGPPRRRKTDVTTED